MANIKKVTLQVLRKIFGQFLVNFFLLPDTIITLRDQLEDIKRINLEMYTKLQVHF